MIDCDGRRKGTRDAPSEPDTRVHDAADTAHLAGLLHDVGKLLMPAAFGIDAGERIVVGVTPSREAEPGDVMELMERADRALYAVKPGGRRAR